MKALKKWLPIVAAALAVLSIVFYLFLDAVKIEAMGFSDGAKGWDIMVGKDGMEFVVMMLVAVLCFAAGAVLSVLSFLNPKKAIYMYIAAACLLVGMILTCCTVNFFLSANDAPSEMKDYYKLAIGSILAIVCSIIGAIAAILPKFLKD